METEEAPVTSMEMCVQKYAHFEPPAGELYCQWVWDSVLCWPPTKAGLTARHRCPRFKGIDPTKFAVKRCGINGHWEGRTPGSGVPETDEIVNGSGGHLGEGSTVGGAGEGGALGGSGQGWTNYTPCFTPEMLQLLKKLYAGSEDEAKVKLRIAERTRTLEIVGFSVSLAALLVSLAIFCHFRSLKNNRTRIHKNLFVAMVIQVVIRLTLYIDQAVIRTGSAGETAEAATAAAAAATGSPTGTDEDASPTSPSPYPISSTYDDTVSPQSPPPPSRGPSAPTPAPPPPEAEPTDATTSPSSTESVPTAAVAAAGMKRYRQGIDNTPILCEASYVLLEYARTAMFMWMFIEGLYLHNMITVTVFQEKSYYSVYTLVGWGVPVIMTTAWALTTAMHYGTSKCWWGYNFTLYFWILEGPRLGVILLNFLFLLNIIRVLVVKLRQSHTSEIEQVRKAVRAALVLLPLLGITNVVNMAEAPLDRTAWEFALWSYVTHFLTSFQGLFIAFLYCFLNGEVRTAVGKSVSVYLSLRRDIFGAQQRRNSAFSSVFVAERGGGCVEDSEAGAMTEGGRGEAAEGGGGVGQGSRRKRGGGGGEEEWPRRWRRRQRSRRNKMRRRASTAPRGGSADEEEEEEEEEEEVVVDEVGGGRGVGGGSVSGKRREEVGNARRMSRRKSARRGGRGRGENNVNQGLMCGSGCWCCCAKRNERRRRRRGGGGGVGVGGGGGGDEEDVEEDERLGVTEVEVGEVGGTAPDGTGGFYYCCRRGFVAVSVEPDAPETQV